MTRFLILAIGFCSMASHVVAEGEGLRVADDPSQPLRAKKGDRPIRVIQLVRSDTSLNNSQPKLLRRLYSIEDTAITTK